jgi:hypothetical protein
MEHQREWPKRKFQQQKNLHKRNDLANTRYTCSLFAFECTSAKLYIDEKDINKYNSFHPINFALRTKSYSRNNISSNLEEHKLEKNCKLLLLFAFIWPQILETGGGAGVMRTKP